MSKATVLHGDCLKVLQTLPAESCDSLVTDPPAGIAFMGKTWDGSRGGRDKWIEWLSVRLAETYRVLKPGAHALVWALPRTAHWTGIALENAGFDMRDCVIHHFGSGFPKSLDVSLAIDKAAGVEREVIGKSRRHGGGIIGNGSSFEVSPVIPMITGPATEAAKQWNGWGTALKPSQEMWWLARKPFSGSVAGNVLVHGTGALNVDECRVPGVVPQVTQGVTRAASNGGAIYGNGRDMRAEAMLSEPHIAGRWPPNTVFSHAALLDPVTGETIGDACASGCVDGCPVAELDKQSGLSSSEARIGKCTGKNAGTYGAFTGQPNELMGHDDTGGASRFFPCFRYQAKAATRERPVINGKAHPTVKSIALMTWLVKLVTPPGGMVLDCFAGTGSTGEACLREFFDCTLIDEDAESVEYMRARLDPGQLNLFNTVNFTEQPAAADLSSEALTEPEPTLFDVHDSGAGQ